VGILQRHRIETREEAVKSGKRGERCPLIDRKEKSMPMNLENVMLACSRERKRHGDERCRQLTISGNVV